MERQRMADLNGTTSEPALAEDAGPAPRLVCLRPATGAIERLIADNPDLHAWGNGTAANWSATPDALRFLGRHLSPGMRTLETGAGQTTVTFAAVGTRHTCVTPDAGEAARIRAYCAARGITCDGVSFVHEDSDVALARPGVVPDVLDFVFIDGAHRFPLPCLDWHYTEGRLRVGGILGVDDWDMPSVRVLHDFLAGEDEWDLVGIVGRTSFFRRLRQTLVVNDCQGQNINRIGRAPRSKTGCEP